MRDWGINMNNQDQALIFEMSREGRIGYSLPELDVPETELESLLPGDYIRDEDAKRRKYQSSILCGIIPLFLRGTTELIQAFIRSAPVR